MTRARLRGRFTPAAPLASPKGVMLTDRHFNAIAMQFSPRASCFSRGQPLMNIMPRSLPTAMPAASICRWVWACTRRSSSPTSTPPSWAPDLGSTSLRAYTCSGRAHYQQMAADSKLKDKDLSFIRNYAAGGDAIPSARENGQRVPRGPQRRVPHGQGLRHDGGLLAATAAAWRTTSPAAWASRWSTRWCPSLSRTPKELPIGERGELCISGPTMMKGYYNKPAETAAILRPHADGRVWGAHRRYRLHGRGRLRLPRLPHQAPDHPPRWLQGLPSMIENVISQHPAVHQCSVVGCTEKDHVQGRLPFVYIVLDPEAAVRQKASGHQASCASSAMKSCPVCAAGGLQVHRLNAHDPRREVRLPQARRRDHPPAITKPQKRPQTREEREPTPIMKNESSASPSRLRALRRSQHFCLCRRAP